MEKEIIYRLNNPNYTIYHRAALGGLAATVRAWGTNLPDGINAQVEKDQVRLAWSGEISDQEALKRILAASFKLTKDKLIDLPGQGIRDDRYGLRLAIHNGLISTFLQHPKMRPTIEKAARKFEVKMEDDESSEIFTYKTVDSYAHQKAQGTGLLEDKLKGKFPVVATIPQSIIPGASQGAQALSTSPEEAILLLFLMVGCSIFLLRPRTYQEKVQSCIVIPDVINLTAFADSLHYITQAGKDIKRFTNTYLGHIVGGAEEAALRFLIDLESDQITNESSVIGCQVIAMGKVAWDANQINRSISIKIQNNYTELEVFRAAATYLGKPKIIKSNKGDNFVVPSSPVPELIAANLAAERHWCSHFTDLVKEKKDFQYMLYAKGGLIIMKDAIKDLDDQALINVFHEAWKYTRGALYKRATDHNLNYDRLKEVEQERTRNAILRAKTAEALASWFLRFCADATKGSSLPTLRDNAEQIRAFIFNPRNFERFQNLCLFALVSYKSKTSKNTTGGNE